MIQAAVRPDLPSGTVTFLFTDVEGSTRLLHELGAEGYADALAEHRGVIREACGAEGGVEVDTQGDAFFFAFPSATGAVNAASVFTEALASGPISVRVGLHTGRPLVTGEGYVGDDVHFAARVAASSHGGQVVLSRATAELLDVALTDLGEHRLKDIAEAVPIYQLGDGSFPPLKTISNTNLPRPASSFVGREAELTELLVRIEAGARLVTLTGPGGSGKTRLAIEAASTLVPEYKAGVFWVGLSALRDPALVTETIAHTLGAKDGLAEHIHERELLLLLDNLEQVIEAAPELSALLQACPNLTLLATSRELLRVSGEVEYAVPPLVEPEAVALFGERSQLESSTEIAELCVRLDNLPLAVELAAARTKALSPAQILERLSQRLDLLKGGRDADPRQQTLRATIEWSYELLSPEEQRHFARLSVFAGGCTLEAAAEVAGADLDTLQSLIEKSLLRFTNERYWMLETIREYAVERLAEEADDGMVRERHYNHVLDLCERAYSERLVSASAWQPTLAAEHNNIRAALDWARDRRPAAETQLAGAVAPYWMWIGYAPETRVRLERALATYDARDWIRARALTHRGELDDELPILDEALSLWRDLGDARGEALALEAIGWAHDAHGDHLEAQRAHELSLDVRRQAGASDLEGLRARAGLCHVLVASGDIERAERTAEELLALAAQHGASRMQQIALHFLADCPLVGGDFAEAEGRYCRALAFARNAGLVWRCVDEVVGVAMSASGRGEFARAVELASAAHVERENLALGADDRWWSRMQAWFIGGARAQLGPDELEAAVRAGSEADWDDVLDEVLGVSKSDA
jgi:predicted ATPase/class 3 adenylate cyclase